SCIVRSVFSQYMIERGYKMFASMKKKIQSSLILKRILWSVGIIFVYMLGKYIPIGTLPVYSEIGAGGYDLTSSLDTLAMVSGGNFSMQNLFSLGLSPWMTSMILWRFLSLFKVVKVATKRQTQLWQMSLMFIIAFIQAYGYSGVSDYFEIPALGPQSKVLLRISSIVILIAGSYVLAWLAAVNARKGVGGPSVIIISNMTLTFLVNIARLVSENRFNIWIWLLITLFVLGGASILIWITIRVFRAEYRIPIRRITIVSSFAEETYIPLKLTPAGGMPFMYAMTLMTLPPLFISILLGFFPDNEALQYLSQHFSMSQLVGIIFYLILLFILAIGFAFFNLDPGEIAEGMQKGGDYIEGVRPGEATKKYIGSYLWKLAIIGAIYTSLMGGIPMLIIWSQSGQISFAILIQNIYIMTTLMLGIVEQISVMQTWKQYDDLI
ncbi:TPA: accessory Sec system protein translocase subunit SecY2, partial [Streptococcus suis]